MEHWRIVLINEGRIIQNCEDYHLLLCIYLLVFVSCILSVAICLIAEKTKEKTRNWSLSFIF